MAVVVAFWFLAVKVRLMLWETVCSCSFFSSSTAARGCGVKNVVFGQWEWLKANLETFRVYFSGINMYIVLKQNTAFHTYLQLSINKFYFFIFLPSLPRGGAPSCGLLWVISQQFSACILTLPAFSDLPWHHIHKTGCRRSALIFKKKKLFSSVKSWAQVVFHSYAVVKFCEIRRGFTYVH